MFQLLLNRLEEYQDFLFSPSVSRAAVRQETGEVRRGHCQNSWPKLAKGYSTPYNAMISNKILAKGKISGGGIWLPRWLLFRDWLATSPPVGGCKQFPLHFPLPYFFPSPIKLPLSQYPRVFLLLFNFLPALHWGQGRKWASNCVGTHHTFRKKFSNISQQEHLL